LDRRQNSCRSAAVKEHLFGHVVVRNRQSQEIETSARPDGERRSLRRECDRYSRA